MKLIKVLKRIQELSSHCLVYTKAQHYLEAHKVIDDILLNCSHVHQILDLHQHISDRLSVDKRMN